VLNRQAVDWKEDLSQLDYSTFEILDELRDKCLSLMQRLGIVFGCIDIICGHDGRWTFLEVNEMGAFLWIEEFLPSIPLLAAFCDFLQDGSSKFQWSGKVARLSMAEFRASPDFERYKCEFNPDSLQHQYEATIDEQS
jgi:hypothetical protein